MFKEVTQNSYEISYDDYYTERRVISGLLVQQDKGSAQQMNSPKYLIRAHQTKDRKDTPSRINNIAIFDKLDLCKIYLQMGRQR